MSWPQVKGVLAQEAYISKRSTEIWFDLLVVSTMSILVFGFLSRYLTEKSDPLSGEYVILGLLLWEIIRINQYCVSVNTLWNVWSRNLSNIFVAPVSVSDYVI